MPTGVDECPFCRIIAGDDPSAREIYRDSHVVAFFPTKPATLGHTLLVPRRHVADIWGLDRGTVAQLGEAAISLAGAVRRSLNPDGLNIIQSNGAAATQTVMHVHVHIVPRWKDDQIGPIWPRETNYSENQKDEAWESLRGECRRLMSGK